MAAASPPSAPLCREGSWFIYKQAGIADGDQRLRHRCDLAIGKTDAEQGCFRALCLEDRERHSDRRCDRQDNTAELAQRAFEIEGEDSFILDHQHFQPGQGRARRPLHAVSVHPFLHNGPPVRRGRASPQQVRTLPSTFHGCSWGTDREGPRTGTRHEQ
jgi:hypothetical protein